VPYIDQSNRAYLDNPIRSLDAALQGLGDTVGDLNYVVTRLMLEQFKRSRSYTTASRVRGAVADARDEFYRRHVAPYEDAAIERNGDVQ
jgi:hypothetical protein